MNDGFTNLFILFNELDDGTISGDKVGFSVDFSFLEGRECLVPIYVFYEIVSFFS